MGKWSPAATGGASKAIVKGTKKGTNGSKMGRKRCLRRVVVTANYNDNDKEANGSDEEYVMAAECDSMCQAWQPNELFEKLLEAATEAHILHHDEKLHDFRGSLQGQEFLWRPGRKGRDTRPGGGGVHVDLRWTPHPTRGAALLT
jgi:hypothetical protein